LNYKLLLVCDSEARRRELPESLQGVRPAFDLIHAANADEAMREIAIGPVDAALVDFSRPGTDGLELAALMRRARPGMPVAVASADLRADRLITALRLKVTFIPRPVTEEALAGFLTQAALRIQAGRQGVRRETHS
jgi:DNA-binding NtrC family response regulator